MEEKGKQEFVRAEKTETAREKNKKIDNDGSGHLKALKEGMIGTWIIKNIKLLDNP